MNKYLRTTAWCHLQYLLLSFPQPQHKRSLCVHSRCLPRNLRSFEHGQRLVVAGSVIANVRLQPPDRLHVVCVHVQTGICQSLSVQGKRVGAKYAPTTVS